MGRLGTANITIKEYETLVGKRNSMYKLFRPQNECRAWNHQLHLQSSHEQALKNVAARHCLFQWMMTEYMVIDYIQSLNACKVEGAQTGQELEGRYSKFVTL